MLEGLPPNNATHKLRLVCDEKRARAIADLIVESFEPAGPLRPPSRPRSAGRVAVQARLVEPVRFRADEDALRELVAVAAGPEAAKAVEFGVTEKRDSVADALAAWHQCAPGATSSMARMTALRFAPATSA